MTEREALKLALEALELTARDYREQRHAITAIREVLAQPEQEPVAWRWGVPKLKNGDFEWRYSLNQTRPDAIPLYTTPPQRTWVGLTENEFKQIMLDTYNIDLDVPGHSSDDHLLWKAIEEKLRSKNT